MTRRRSRRRKLGAAALAFALAVGLVGAALVLMGGGSASSGSERRSGALPAAPLRPASSETRARPVPVLMYHVIATAAAGAPCPDLFVAPTDFAGQMRWLARHGYHARTLRAVWDSWHGGRALPGRPVVVTFDDGYRSQVGVALLVLRRLGWPGVLDLKVGNLGPGGLRPRGVRRLIAAGWEIDAHSLTHPDLTTVGDTRLEQEVAGSRAAIRQRFHVPVDFFCYPAGRYDARVIAAVRRAGFLGATTTDFGLARPGEPYTLERVRVSGSDGVAGFAAKLESLTG